MHKFLLPSRYGQNAIFHFLELIPMMQVDDAVNPEKDVDLDIVDSIKARDNILSKRLPSQIPHDTIIMLKILSHRQDFHAHGVNPTTAAAVKPPFLGFSSLEILSLLY